MSRSSLSGRSHTTSSSDDDRRPYDAVEQSKFHPAKNGQVPLGVVKSYATRVGWLNNHIPASFGFSKQWKKRYFVLVDSMLFIYKDDNPNLVWRNFMELSKDTIVFVTNEFGNKLYCIEIRKPGQERSWYVQADGPDDTKVWLNDLKGTVKWIKTGKRDEDDVASTLSDSVSSLDLSVNRHSQQQQQQHLVQPPPPAPEYTNRPPPPVPSDPRSPTRYKMMPPPLPPPTSILPPTPTSRSPPISRSNSFRQVPPPTPPPFTSLPAIPGNSPYVKSPAKASRS
ncbi:hypothetical protein K450DRAFT_232977 [Umbelopsis ramanniana AG]|uniref:PH domain-containing protein n=1 Tax=Umbelopsis ramanniana AG TaxID=1314678 RepID=A0AAD5EDJ0_UMBRA|nr:uncharacterized protein K450DRAFT_232977 [Umbelopsis ramanniana AG]KAI8581422.1 hypothetical protein K450DRAFT_232977 [Umbelopsis ramanniana AG]